MRPARTRGITLAALLLVAGCVQPEFRECSVLCGPGRTCPASYHSVCGDDNYCHAEGQQQHVCDMGVVVVVDQGADFNAIVADLTAPAIDLAGVDLRGVDLNPGVDLKPPVDLKPIPDLNPGVDLKPPPVDLLGDLFSTASLCSTSGLVFCDGFETTALDPHWTGSSINVTSVVGGHRGARSARFTVAAGGRVAQLVTTTPFPTLANDIWARAFIEMPVTRPGYVALMEITDNGGEGWLLSAANGSLQLDEYGGVTSKSGTMPLASDRFVCVEWHLGGGEIHAYMDGVEVPELAVTGRTLPPWGTFLFSTSLVSNATAVFSARMDEVALHSSRITCAK